MSRTTSVGPGSIIVPALALLLVATGALMATLPSRR
jgi:hypothetical protein